MAVTVVKICNSALAKVGAPRISSITEETKAAIILNSIFEQCRDDVLRAHPWNFATKRTTLAPTGDEPDHEYDYEYDLPPDCLRVLSTYPDDIDYVVESGKILTNESELLVRYIWRNEDPSLWDSCFAEALAWYLASNIAYAITQSSKLVEDCHALYVKKLAEARSMDGAEGIIKGFEVETWTMARR